MKHDHSIEGEPQFQKQPAQIDPSEAKAAKELADQRQRLESRIDEFDRLAASQIEIKSIATETARFLSGLEFTLRSGFPQEKLTALRQCIDQIRVDKPADEAVIAIRMIPAGNLDATQEIRITLAAVSKNGKPAKPDKSAKAGRTKRAKRNSR